MSFFHEPVEGLRLAQNEHIDECFRLLKKQYGQPVHVIEIGTNIGGFSVFLKDMFPNSSVHTFDIEVRGTAEEKAIRQKLFNERQIFFHEEDCFLHEGRKIISLLNEKSILLCDGGHKVNEFAFFANHIKSGSVIMAHDYGKNREYYNEHINGVYWQDSFEFDGSQFDQYCIDRDLQPFLQDEFEKAVWYIRKKL